MISYTFLKTNFVKFPFSVIGAIITRTLLAALTKIKTKKKKQKIFRKSIFEFIKFEITYFVCITPSYDKKLVNKNL